MKACYINSVASISAQDSFKNDSFLEEVEVFSSETQNAIHPKYRDYISPAASRRMATGVKMGVVTAKEALKEAELSNPDAIITGTGLGCIEDSEKFLNAIIDNDEEFLTPTAFIQSTHNTVAAQIALALKCKGYNMTYVHGSLSFESALFDAQLMLHENEAKNILVGGVDELGKQFVQERLSVEKLQEQPIAVPMSEGAHFFTVSSEKQEGSYASLVDVELIHKISEESIQKKAQEFLKQNGLTFSDVDLAVLGKNGDAFDVYYDCFNSLPSIAYKTLSGEFSTASAFGFWMASNILKHQKVPSNFNISTLGSFKNILLYNQFKGLEHSFILLSSC